MSRHVNYDALMDRLGICVKTGMGSTIAFTFKHIVDETPSIDIVRCGECMHNGSYDTDCPFGWRNGEWNLPKPCDFCSYGEREGE